jgi:hypothetical protein
MANRENPKLDSKTGKEIYTKTLCQNVKGSSSFCVSTAQFLAVAAFMKLSVSFQLLDLGQ